jgi:hypothetical protein
MDLASPVKTEPVSNRWIKAICGGDISIMIDNAVPLAAALVMACMVAEETCGTPGVLKP